MMLRDVKKWKFISLMVGILLVFTAQAYGAKFAHPELLVTPADVEKNMGKWIVIDCRDAAATKDKKSGAEIKGYSDGHIPGAISLGGQCAKVLRTKEQAIVFHDDKGNTDVAKYEKMLGDAGIASDKTVVVYADAKGITSASVGFWILEYLGQKDVRFLNGGIEAWVADGKKLDTEEKKLPSAKYKAHLMKNRIATTDEVLKVAKGEIKNVQIVDSRTPGEYAGTDMRAKRGGHIPTCDLNVSHVETFDKKTGMIKSAEELEKLFGKLDKNKRTIPYCQTGTRSTLTYIIFKAMGFKNVANYDDSWIIWGNREDTPI
ncbi:MAG: sulfurtransferase [Nitrospirae bacterium]|nr:sulfurtransferase [Nitrospirota bacterium]